MQLPRAEVVGAETQRAQLRAMRRTLQQGLMLQKGIWFRVAGTCSSTCTALHASSLLHSMLRSFRLGRSRWDTPIDGSRLWL